MTRTARIAALALLVLVLAGCATDEAGAMVACEQLVDRRVGTAVKHLGPMDGETAEDVGDGRFVVSGGFAEPQGGQLTRYTCTVERGDGEWRLVDITTDR